VTELYRVAAFVNDELERIWEELVVCLEGLWESTNPSVRAVLVPAEIQAYIQHHSYTNFFGTF
jgi:hypothetical protein